MDDDILKLVEYLQWKIDMERLLWDYGIAYSHSRLLFRVRYDYADHDDAEWVS